MNLKINHHHIYIVVFTLFFFFWGVNLNDFNDLFKIIDQPLSALTSLILNKIRLSYLIIFLLIPIFYNLIKKRKFHPKEIFNNQKYIIFFILFIIAHFVLVKIYYHEIFAKSEIINLIYLLLLSIIYCHYRNIIIINFEKIIILYLIIFIAYSMIEGSQIYNFGFIGNDGEVYFKNEGQCNNDLFLIDMLRKYLNISLSNSIYLENSHLAMMSIAVFFSGTFILLQEKKINILFLLLFLIEILIVLNNLSTTYFVCYFISQIVLLFFFFKKINIKFWIVSFLLLSINSYLFFSNKNCTVKVTDFKVKDILNKNLVKKKTNLTTLIYKRSAILTLETLKDHSLGWGIDGMDDATQNLMDNYDIEICVIAFKPTCLNNDKVLVSEYNKRTDIAPWRLVHLNTKDGLSNLFKMFTEFGFFAFIIFFYFVKYILNIKNLSSYNLFVIILFVTMCIRGVGYFNGGFIFCILEFFYYKKFVNEVEFKKKYS
jgi:hypothetical protein